MTKTEEINKELTDVQTKAEVTPQVSETDNVPDSDYAPLEGVLNSEAQVVAPTTDDGLHDLRKQMIAIGINIASDLNEYRRSTACENDLQTIAALCQLYKCVDKESQ